MGLRRAAAQLGSVAPGPRPSPRYETLGTGVPEKRVVPLASARFGERAFGAADRTSTTEPLG